MSIYNYVNRVLIGDGANSGTITAVPQIKKGDLIIVKEKTGEVLDATSAAALSKFDTILIGMGVQDGNVVFSSPITGDHVSHYEGQTFVAPSLLIKTVGFDPVNNPSGDLPAELDVEYRLRVKILDDDRFNGQRNTLIDTFGTVEAGETSQELAAKMACLYGQQEYSTNYAADKVLLDRLANLTTGVSVANPASFTKGSSLVSSVGHGFTQADAGTVISIDATGYENVSFLLKEVVSADVFEIDVKSNYTLIDVALESGEADRWGFKLTAIEPESYISNGGANPLDEYEYILFDASYAVADERSVTTAIDAIVYQELNPGQGYWKQVNDREEKAKGYLGDTSKRRFHDKRIQSNVIVGAEYGSVVITHSEVMRGDFQDTYNAPVKTEIYIPTGTAQTSTEFLGVLDAFFSDVVGFAPISSL